MLDSSKSSEFDDELHDVSEHLEEYAMKEKELTEEAIKDKTFPEDVQGDVATFSRKPKKEWYRSKEEIDLENLIFGNKAGLLENLKRSSKSHRKNEDTEQRKAKKRKPAWHDEDDDALQLGEVRQETKYTGSLDHLQKDKPYKEYLQSQFKRVVAEPKWADLDKEDDEDSDEEILHHVGFIDEAKPLALPPTNIEYKKLKDLNRATYAEGQISSIEFHPTSTVAMVSGSNCIATLYSVDGRKNDKLHSIRFKECPITCAKILPCGTRAVFGSRLRRFYSYDLIKATEMRHLLPLFVNRMERFEISPCGSYLAAIGSGPTVNLFDLKSNEMVHIFIQSDRTRSVQFSRDSNYIISSSKGPEITVFDIRAEKVVHIFDDDGCIEGRALAVSPDGKLLATGTAEGVVNVYDYDSIFLGSAPEPQKTFLNLTTPITELKFNSSSEMLAMCSDSVPGGVKLAHIPSGTVFANFPGFNNTLPCVRTMAFSPSSGYLSMGSKSKEALLFRLKHYNNY